MTKTPSIDTSQLPRFDPADYLDSEEAIAVFLADARQEGRDELVRCESIVERARTRWGLSPRDVTILP